MRQLLIKTGAALIGGLALHLPVQAAGMPDVSPVMKNMLNALPIAGFKDEVHKLAGTLKNTPCDGGLKDCYTAKSGPLQLYFFGGSKKAQQTFLLVIRQKIKMPALLKGDVQKLMDGTDLSDPIISISTTDYDLVASKMPADLRAVVKASYFDVNVLNFSSGVQLAARADLGGAIKLGMQSMGMTSTNMVLRAGVVMPIPTDLTGGAGAGAGLADALMHSETMKKAGADALAPETFIELQFAPNAKLPLSMPPVNLSDATFFVDNALTFGFKGNADFKGVNNKPILLHFQTPITPLGAMDLLSFQFLMATPKNLTLEDAANVMLAMVTPDPRLAKYGGGFISQIKTIEQPLKAAVKPLSVFKLQNPIAVPEYKFGDSTKPFPKDPKAFNVVLSGPTTDIGPMIRLAGNVNILGQDMGQLFAQADANGFVGDAAAQVSIKLGPLGVVRFKLQALADVNKGSQIIKLKGNIAGQILELGLAGNTLSIYLSASCVNPFEIKTSLAIADSLNLVEIFDKQGGVNVDPSKLQNCMGADLQAAYNKIAGDFKNLGGYTANEANAALKKIADDAAQAAVAAKAVADKAAADASAAANKAAADAKALADNATAVANQAAQAASNATANAKAASDKVTQTTGDAQKRADDVVKEASRFNTDQVKNWGSAGVNAAGDQITGGLKKVGGAINKATCRLAGNCKKKKKDSQVCIAVYDEEFFLRGHPGTSPDDAYNWWVNTLCKNGDQRGSAEFQVEEYRALNAARYGIPRKNLYYPEELTAHWLSTGIKDGVQGSRVFNIQDYLAQNPELWDALSNNWANVMDHWLKSGINEGRAINAEFRATEYLANYADLRALLGDTNYPAAFDHWVLQGKAEGRKGRIDQAAITQAAADVQAVNDARVAAEAAQASANTAQTAADKAAADAKAATETAQKLMYTAAWQSLDVFSAPEYYELNKARYGFVNPSDYAGLTKHWLEVGMKDAVKGNRLFDIQQYNGKNPGIWFTVTPIGTWEGIWRYWAETRISAASK
jgi:hypothetical protein